MAGIYIHIPFCEQFCTYCNFYSVKGKAYREKYFEVLSNEVAVRKDFFKNLGYSPTTIYFGGGTPSVLKIETLKKVLELVIKEFEITPTEVTIEVNPNDITRNNAFDLYSIGFNRVSMGVQSFVDDHLRWMNRRHSVIEAELAYKYLREAGFKNISLDLIFGFKGLSKKLWEYNLKKIVELSPEHISSYQLSIEKGSKLGQMYENGLYIPLPDDLCNNQYTMLQKYLLENGYAQYEISSFAKKPVSLNKSIHNSSYWTKEPYIGLGPAAHSFNGDIRYWNKSSITQYFNSYKDKDLKYSNAYESEVLSPKDKFNESIMLGLRTVEGINLKDLDNTFFKCIEKTIKKMAKDNVLIIEGERIKIPLDKLFVSDEIIRELFI